MVGQEGIPPFEHCIASLRIASFVLFSEHQLYSYLGTLQLLLPLWLSYARAGSIGVLLSAWNCLTCLHSHLSTIAPPAPLFFSELPIIVCCSALSNICHQKDR